MKSNKVMLITGATSGVGKALAEHYYKKNYKLILVGGSKEKVDKQSIGSQFIVHPNMLFNLLPTVSELKFLKIILGLSPLHQEW